ncbi:MAG: OadG family protein [Bacteroidales bacterium]|nr:OadG family protein [Bacteroidales bacterium]
MADALFLMLVGMLTVFVVLILVVLLGNGIIIFINKFFPEEQVATKPSAAAAPAINANVYSAICSAVSTVTGGKGNVTDVKKL